MTGTHYIIIVFAVIILTPIIFSFFRDGLARSGYANTKFSEAWEKFLNKHMPFFSKLSPNEQVKIRKKVNVLIAEKDLLSFDGLIRSDEMKIGIFSYAALTSINNKDYFEEIKELHTYPTLPEGKPIREGEILNFDWSDEKGTSNPYAYWVEKRFNEYTGSLSKEDFIINSIKFFKGDKSLNDQDQKDLQSLFGLDPRLWN